MSAIPAVSGGPVYVQSLRERQSGFTLALALKTTCNLVIKVPITSNYGLMWQIVRVFLRLLFCFIHSFDDFFMKLVFEYLVVFLKDRRLFLQSSNQRVQPNKALIHNCRVGDLVSLSKAKSPNIGRL